jgi:hypothetical protein
MALNNNKEAYARNELNTKPVRETLWKCNIN